ncbi:MAG: hypothetical protein JW791_02545 [Nanoarchaeota archaeon]|nr:hypothetical protein [Nanoarchaeota archaeon]
MKKLLILAVIFVSFPIVFSQSIDIGGSDYPMKVVCEQLKQVSLTFDNELFQGTDYEDLKEFPPEIIDYINKEMEVSEELNQALTAINGISFSTEILYNTSLCFGGSFMFNNSKLVFFKLEPDTMAGEDEDHILFHIELKNIEAVVKEFKNIEMREGSNPLANIGVMIKAFFTLISSLIKGDISITPLSGIFKVVDGIRVFMELPDFGELQTELGQQIQAKITP